jgi:hypothetical protein
MLEAPRAVQTNKKWCTFPLIQLNAVCLPSISLYWTDLLASKCVLFTWFSNTLLCRLLMLDWSLTPCTYVGWQNWFNGSQTSRSQIEKFQLLFQSSLPLLLKKWNVVWNNTFGDWSSNLTCKYLTWADPFSLMVIYSLYGAACSWTVCPIHLRFNFNCYRKDQKWLRSHSLLKK